MSQVFDGRLPGRDLYYTPGTTLTAIIEVDPSEDLAGRTFTSTFDGVAVTALPDNVAKTITIIVPKEVTGPRDKDAVRWELVENDEPIVLGTWTPSFKARGTRIL